MMTRWLARGCGLIVLLLLIAGAPRDAAACFDNDDWLGPCGPALALPTWGTGAWGAPEQYSTIQTADVDGDGAAELLGRSAIGLEVHKFDTDNGLWLSFPDPNNPQLFSDFSDHNHWSFSGSLRHWVLERGKNHVQATELERGEDHV